MDKRLFNAAWAGDVVALRKLTKEDPKILHSFSLAGDNPLHIACMAGHLHFAKEMIKLKKNIVDELNGDGLSSLHIAAANGDLEIVKELVNIDGEGGIILCMVKGSEGRIPLHCAVIKGRFEVVKELVAVDPRSVVETTARGETVLHLAVKNNQFKILQFLVGYLNGLSMQNLLKNQDDEGNTILHLAIFKKQYEVINFLLGKDENSEVMVDVNARNVNGQTPLDVLLLMHNEMGDDNYEANSYHKRMENILVQAGAQKGSNESSANNELLPLTHAEMDQSNQAELSSEDILWYTYFKYKAGRDSPGDVRNCLLVIVALITTATYQAILSPPGGAWQDTGSSGVDGKSYIAGRPIMQTYSPVLYGFFLYFNTAGFSACVYMIWLLTAGFPLRYELNTALGAIVITYEISIAAFTPKGAVPTVFLVFSMVMPLLMAYSFGIYRAIFTAFGVRYMDEPSP